MGPCVGGGEMKICAKINFFLFVLMPIIFIPFINIIFSLATSYLVCNSWFKNESIELPKAGKLAWALFSIPLSMIINLNFYSKYSGIFVDIVCTSSLISLYIFLVSNINYYKNCK